MIYKFDSKVLALHQQLVDKTGKEREFFLYWIANIYPVFCIAILCINYFANGAGAHLLIGLILSTISCVVYYVYVKEADRLAALPFLRGFRLIGFPIVLLSLPMILSGNYEFKYLLADIKLLLTISYLYFVSCGKPKPPLRKKSTKLIESFT